MTWGLIGCYTTMTVVSDMGQTQTAHGASFICIGPQRSELVLRHDDTKPTMRASKSGRSTLRKRLQLVTLSAFATGCMLAAVVLISQVFVQLDDYGSANQDNLQWTTSRLEVDQLKYLAALQALTGPDTMQVDNVRRQFDVLYSRATALRNGRIYREILSQNSAQRDLDHIQELLAKMVPIIDGDILTLFDKRKRLIFLGHQMAKPIRSIASRGLAADARRSDAERETLTTEILTLSALILLMLAAQSLLLFVIWRLYRSYRAQAERSKSASNRLETILNTSQDAVLVVGPDGRIEHTNVRADHMLALPSNPIAPVELGDFLFYKQKDGQLKRLKGNTLRETCSDGPKRREDVVVRNFAGREFAAELSADLAKRGQNTICICFLRDISERVAAESEIAKARDRALAGERAKAQFLAMISHEMRTPLNGILGALELLDDTGLSEEQDKFTRIMRSSGQLLLTQITDALDLTQAAARQIVLRPAAFDLDELLAELTETQQGPAHARGNNLRLLAPEGGLGRVDGDRARIFQVLLNLVSNAIKFTRDGEITLKVARLCSAEDGESIVEFQVADTGIGISKADLPNVFDDFMRVQDISGDRPEGTGLGLGIARQLVTLMSGTIGVESELGQGSLFSVRLPLPAVTRPITASETPQPVTPDAHETNRKLSILVVEDNSTNSLVLESMLTSDGHAVQLACDGVEGLERAESDKFDLILMDISMPRMDGIEATRRIRAGAGPNAKTPVVALTAHVRTEDRRDLRNAGFDRVETKPLRREALRAAINQTATTTASPETSSPCVDPTHLTQLRAALPQHRIDQLLAEFETEGAAILEELSRADLRAKTKLADRTHKLAGTAASTGALALQALLGRVEAALRTGDETAAKAATAALPDLLTKTLSQLKDDTRVH